MCVQRVGIGRAGWARAASGMRIARGLAAVALPVAWCVQRGVAWAGGVRAARVPVAGTRQRAARAGDAASRLWLDAVYAIARGAGASWSRPRGRTLGHT